MEVALTKPFLPLEKLCLSTFDGKEQILKKELFLLHKHLKFSMNELLEMPIQDRKFYLAKHNEEIEKEN